MSAPFVIPATAGATFPASGSFTFGEMKRDIARVAGVLDDPDMEALAGTFVNDIIDDLNRRQTWTFNLVTSPDITTVAGTSSYALPADFWKIYNSRKTDGIDYQLTTLRQKDFDTLFVSQRNINGFMYTLVIKNTFRGGTVQLFPTPDGAYTLSINYYKFISRLTSDDQVLDLPQPYQTIPKYGAESRMMATVNQYEAAKYWNDLYEQGVMKMSRSDEDTGDEELRFIQVEEVLARSYSWVNPASRPRSLDLF